MSTDLDRALADAAAHLDEIAPPITVDELLDPINDHSVLIPLTYSSPTRRRPLVFVAAAAVVLVVGIGGLIAVNRPDHAGVSESLPDSSAATTVTAVLVPGPEPLGYVPTRDEVTSAVAAFASCLGEHLTGTIRYDPDQPGGAMMLELSDPSVVGPTARISSEQERCERETNVQGFLEAFVPDPADARAEHDVIGDFEKCVVDQIPDIEADLHDADFATAADLELGYLELIRSTSPNNGEVISDCHDEAVYGAHIIQIGS